MSEKPVVEKEKQKLVAEKAFECIESIMNTFKDSSDVPKSFRSRARSIPTDQFTKGLHYVLTLLAARSSKNWIEKGLQSNNCEEIAQSVKNSKLSPEEGGYALYGAVLAYILRSTGLTNAKTFKDLVYEALNNPIINTRSTLILEWIKRLAEAYIESE